MAAILEGLFPALQTVTVEHAHFPGGYRAMRYASMSDQYVHEMIRSDPMISWNSHTKTFWRLLEMDRTFSMHISIGSRQEEDGIVIVCDVAIFSFGCGYLALMKQMQDFLIDADVRTVDRTIRNPRVTYVISTSGLVGSVNFTR